MDYPEARREAEIKRMRAVIAKITAKNLELKMRFEVGRLVPSTDGDEGSCDADR
jgi:hypothetical protein